MLFLLVFLFSYLLDVKLLEYWHHLEQDLRFQWLPKQLWICFRINQLQAPRNVSRTLHRMLLHKLITIHLLMTGQCYMSILKWLHRYIFAFYCLRFFTVTVVACWTVVKLWIFKHTATSPHKTVSVKKERLLLTTTLQNHFVIWNAHSFLT